MKKVTFALRFDALKCLFSASPHLPLPSNLAAPYRLQISLDSKTADFCFWQPITGNILIEANREAGSIMENLAQDLKCCSYLSVTQHSMSCIRNSCFISLMEQPANMKWQDAVTDSSQESMPLWAKSWVPLTVMPEISSDQHTSPYREATGRWWSTRGQPVPQECQPVSRLNSSATFLHVGMLLNKYVSWIKIHYQKPISHVKLKRYLRICFMALIQAYLPLIFFWNTHISVCDITCLRSICFHMLRIGNWLASKSKWADSINFIR